MRAQPSTSPVWKFVWLTLLCIGTLGVVAPPTDAHAQQAHDGWRRGHPLFVPSLGFHYGASTRLDEGGRQEDLIEGEHFVFWGGFSVYPRPDRHNFYGAIGLEVEFSQLADDTDITTFMPMIHGGWSYLGCHEEIQPLAATFSCLKIYGLAGVRPSPIPRSLPSMRLGLGINSIWAPAVGIVFGALIPSTLEVIYEVDPYGRQVSMVRVGISF